MPRLPFALTLLLLSAAPAAAHEYWLAASSFAPVPGQAVSVGALAGTGFRGERKPWSATRCVRFVARTGRTLDLAPLGRNGDVSWAGFVPADDGGAMLAFESDYAAIELPAAEFEAYLRLEGLDAALAERRRLRDLSNGRERYRRCPKAWLAGSDAERATRPIGLPLEIVPVSLPGSSRLLGVQLLWKGRPLANALLKAFRAPPGSDPEVRDSVGVAWQARTDAHGRAVVPLAEPGEWMIASVHMDRSHDRNAADWESTWASLTFTAAARPDERQR